MCVHEDNGRRRGSPFAVATLSWINAVIIALASDRSDYRT